MANKQRQRLGEQRETSLLYKAQKKTLLFSTGVLYWLSAVMLMFFTLTSLLRTSYLQQDYTEVIHFKADNPLFLLPLFALLLLLLYGISIKKPWKKISPRWLEVGLLAYVFLLGTAWLLLVRSHPVADSQQITLHAADFLQGDFHGLGRADYMGKYPYQLGFTLYVELVFSVAGVNNHLLLQFINLASIVLAYHEVLAITRLVFPGQKVYFFTVLLLFGCLPPILYSTFIYGLVLGFAFALLALHFTLRYRRNRKWYYIPLILLFCWVATLFKMNYLIFAIAICIFLLLDFISTLHWKSIVAAVLVLVVSVFAMLPVYSLYQRRSGVKLTDGVPMLGNIAMGLQDSDMGPGWYSRLNENLYVENDYESGLANAAAKREIKQAVLGYLKNPLDALRFFYQKTVSQWNEPTFGSLWVSHDANQHDPRLSPFATSLYEGLPNVWLQEYMNFYHFVVMIGSALCFVLLKKRMDRSRLLLAMVVLGGFLFHMFWEAKSQYVWPYFVLLVPYAAAGISTLLRRVQKVRIKIKAKQLQNAARQKVSYTQK